MNTNSNDGWSSGRSENSVRSIPPIEIDCSDWESDIPAEQWSHGTFVSVTRSLPPIEIDCSTWDAAPAGWLELVVGFEAEADMAAVQAATTQLVEALAGMAPELRLVYDAARSRVTADGDVIVALKPENPGVTAARLKEFLGQVNGAKLDRVRKIVVCGNGAK